MQIFFFLEQMRLFSLITLFLREISFLVLGIEILIIVLEKEAEAGGMIGNDWAVRSNLNGVFPRCGNETLADIHWGELVLTSAKGSAPTTEMKIRPLDFLRTFRKISNTTYLVNSDFRVFLSVQGLEVISNVKFTQ